MLEALGRVSAKLAAARAQLLSRFDATRGHDADGYGSSAAWLAARDRITRKAAGAEVRRMRQFRTHPVIARRRRAARCRESWAAEMADWTRKLPPDWRDDVDKLLVDTAAAGANLEDLAIVARAAYEKWRSQQPDPDDDDDGFDDRYLKLGTTIDNAGRVTGDLTPECTAARAGGPGVTGQEGRPGRRPHRAAALPRRAAGGLRAADPRPAWSRTGPAPTPASTSSSPWPSCWPCPAPRELQEAWLAALAGEHGYLAGTDAEAAACDAIITPVVTGHPDLSVVDQMIDIILAYLDAADDDAAGSAATGDSRHGRTRHGRRRSGGTGPDRTRQRRAPAAPRRAGTTARPLSGPRPCPPRRGRHCGTPSPGSRSTWSPGRTGSPRSCAAACSTPRTTASPSSSTSATPPASPAPSAAPSQLRARHCEWPGCRKPPAALRRPPPAPQERRRRDIRYEIVFYLCQFHHDMCIHRWGWRLVLHPDATTTAYGPNGQVIHSHGPPGKQGPPGNKAA